MTNSSMYNVASAVLCCSLAIVRSLPLPGCGIAIFLMGKRELVALLNLSSWCLVMVERLILAVPRGCLRFVIVVFPDHTPLLFMADNEAPHQEDITIVRHHNSRYSLY